MVYTFDILHQTHFLATTCRGQNDAHVAQAEEDSDEEAPQVQQQAQHRKRRKKEKGGKVAKKRSHQDAQFFADLV